MSAKFTDKDRSSNFFLTTFIRKFSEKRTRISNFHHSGCAFFWQPFLEKFVFSGDNYHLFSKTVFGRNNRFLDKHRVKIVHPMSSETTSFCGKGGGKCFHGLTVFGQWQGDHRFQGNMPTLAYHRKSALLTRFSFISFHFINIYKQYTIQLDLSQVYFVIRNKSI